MATAVNFGDNHTEWVGGSGLRAINFEITLPRNPALAAVSSWCGFPFDGLARVYLDKVRLEIKLHRGGQVHTIASDPLKVLLMSNNFGNAAYQKARFADHFSRKGDSITMGVTFTLYSPLVKQAGDKIEVTLRIQNDALGKRTPTYEVVPLSSYDTLPVLVAQTGDDYGNLSTSNIKLSYDEPHPNEVEFATPIYRTHYLKESQLSPNIPLEGSVVLVDIVSNRYASGAGLIGYENSDGVRIFNSAVLKAKDYTDSMTSEELYAESLLNHELASIASVRHNHYRIYADTQNRLEDARIELGLTDATNIVKNMNTYVHWISLYVDGRMIAAAQQKEEQIATARKLAIMEITPQKYKKEAAKALEM